MRFCLLVWHLVLIALFLNGRIESAAIASMKKILPLLFLSLWFFSVSYAQGDENLKYFDQNYKQLPQSTFEILKREKKFLEVQGDSVNHRILSFRGYEGNLQNRNVLDSLLSAAIGKQIDASKTLVIIYYPGKDACNSSSSATISSRNALYKRLEKKLFKITQTKPVYNYKDAEGLERYGDIMTWNKDPDETIENIFFKYHYPCSSFVVISKDGDFISSFGEFLQEAVLNTAKNIEEL